MADMNMRIMQRHGRLFALLTLVFIVCAFAVATIPAATHAETAQVQTLAGDNAPAPKPATTVDGSPGFFASIWYAIVAGISSLLISISAWLLSVAGVLFNWLVSNTIVNFKTSIFDAVSPGVDAGWSAFRDIANIVIIGMFTFISISIILGNKEYGQMRMVARVLIIAVLINFSLLFTKMIVDASNFTAAQFYTAMNYPSSAQQTNIGATGTGPTDGYAQVGIAGAFVGFLGVTGIGDTFNAIQGLTKVNGGWAAFAHGVFAAVLLGGAAFVLLYGSYLLVSRAVLLIFLMITSAIAFATYLIPKAPDSEYGWSTWWRSLLGSAVLAPLLMVFLWITLAVAAKLKVTTGTLGNLISGNAGGADIGALFAYLIILGLLWGSFKLASTFAKTISGISVPAMVAAAPLVLASRFLVAPPLRQLAGRGFAKRSLELDEEIGQKKYDLARTTKGTPEYKKALDSLAATMRAKERVDTLAKSSFNAANLGPVKAATKAIGLPSYLTGVQAKPKGFADVAKERAAAAAKKAETLVISKTDAEEKELEKRRTNDDAQRKLLREQREAAHATLEAAKSMAASRKPEIDTLERTRQDKEQELVRANADAPGEMGTIQMKYDSQIKPLETKLADPDTSAEEGNQARNQIDGLKSQRESEIKQVDDRIQKARTDVETAKDAIETLKQSIQKPVEDAQAALKKAENAEKENEKTIEKEVRDAAQNIAKASSAAVPDMAEHIVHRRLTNFLPRIFGEKPENDTMARMARGAAKKTVKKMSLRERLSILKDIEKEEEGGEGTESKGAGAAGLPPAAHH